MKIKDVIANMKSYHRGLNANGEPIDEETTRDKILYGNPDKECTGIVTTCWASVDVIKKAHELNANLIICHEALFWNHGDHTEWLADNEVFQQKRALLDQTGIVVWRDHDYIHSGIPMKDGTYSDGIFYGVMKKLGWEDYLIQSKVRPMNFVLPEVQVKDLAKQMMEQLHLNGIRIVGDPNAKIRRVCVIGHVMGGDNDKISRINDEGIDLLITLELIDYTVSEYIRDAGMLNKQKAILSLGHFNAEEPGMEYMLEYIHEAVKEDVPAFYVQSGDMYSYVTRA